MLRVREVTSNPSVTQPAVCSLQHAACLVQPNSIETWLNLQTLHSSSQNFPLEGPGYTWYNTTNTKDRPVCQLLLGIWKMSQFFSSFNFQKKQAWISWDQHKLSSNSDLQVERLEISKYRKIFQYHRGKYLLFALHVQALPPTVKLIVFTNCLFFSLALDLQLRVESILVIWIKLKQRNVTILFQYSEFNFWKITISIMFSLSFNEVRI